MGGIVSRWNTSKSQPPPNVDVKEEDPVLTRTLGFAWVTLATNDSYSLGALVLAHSLRNVKTAHKLAVLITPAVSSSMREQLSTVFDLVKVVDVLDSKDEAHLALMKRPELGVTYTKLHCWRLTEFEKCVFLDADTLVIKNCDELFDREELSAAPDVGWPDCFNTGVFVYKPSIDTFNNLIKFSMEQASFDGGDQGLLNQYYGDWATKDISKHLPFVYNLTSVAVYSYIPAFKQYGSDVRIVHFIGSAKPWLQQLDPNTKTVNPTPGAEHLAPLLQMWWDIFCEKVHPSMSTNLECASGMSNDEIEACANNIPLETEPTEFIQPFTSYIDKDDSRQINLPYHPFDVKSSSGVLLNVTYLEQLERDMLEQQIREKEEERERNEKENNLREEEQIMKEKEEEERKEVYCSIIDENKESEVEEKEEEQINVCKAEVDTEIGLSLAQPILDEPPKEEELPPQVETSPFNYDVFFPDEICVQNYLENNFFTYQTQVNEKKNVDFEVLQEKIPPLPRFLTIAEDDKRQSLNACFEEPQPPPQQVPIQDALPAVCPPSKNCVDEKALGSHSEENLNVVEITSESQSAEHFPNLEDNWPSTKPAVEFSFWKSYSNLNADPNKKYPMPKLKPLLPKQNVSYMTVNEARPKITQYTEFHMNYDCGDYAVSDKLGFIERHILQEVKMKDMDKDTKLKTLSYIFPQKRVSKENKPSFVPPENFHEMTDYDFSLCQRQKGNQPLANVTNKRANSCFLPVLKPLKPSRNCETTRRLNSNGLKPKDRGTKASIESRKAREKAKTEIKPKVQPQNVEDVLKRLINFSKGYQKYFTTFTTGKQKSVTAVAPNIIKNGYIVPTESPRLQYSKEFEENVDTPSDKVSRSRASPHLNSEYFPKMRSSGEHSVADYVTVAATSPVAKFINSNYEKRNEEVEEITVKKSIDLDLSEQPIKFINENSYHIKRLGSERAEDVKSQEATNNRRSKLKRRKEENELSNGLERNPTKEAEIVKQKESTLVKDSTYPARNTNKRQRSHVKTKKNKAKKDISGTKIDVNKTSAPPHAIAKEPTAKSCNHIFTLLPDDSSDQATKKAGTVRSVSSRPDETFSQSVGKKCEGTRKVKAATSVDDSGTNNSGIAGAIAKLSLQPGSVPGAQGEASSSAQEDYIRRQNWEMGTMDYMGRDSFNNIWSKICETLDEKVTQNLGLDGESKTKSNAPSEEIKSDNIKPGSGQLDDIPDKMTVEDKKGDDAPPPQTDVKLAGIGSESFSKTDSSNTASDLSSKASQALEAFGKLFVSGPVAIKSEGVADAPKLDDTNKSKSADEKTEQAEPEEVSENVKSVESNEEGKKKKGVLSKILELVGVESSTSPKSVFYDTEDSKPESDKVGQSVFYDVDVGQGMPTNLNVVETASTKELKRSSSPSLQLKTTPDTEIVPPTPPTTPCNVKIDSQDGKFLAADNTIVETPPVTDKKLLKDICDKEVVKSEVEGIIEKAVQCAEDLKRASQEQVSAKVEELSGVIPKANEALEAFGKLFVSGPVTIKSEVPEEIPKSSEATEGKDKAIETAPSVPVKKGTGEDSTGGTITETLPAQVGQDVSSKAFEITAQATPEPTEVESNASVEKAQISQETVSSQDQEVLSKVAETSQAIVKSVEPSTGDDTVPPQSSPDVPAADIAKPTESKVEVSPKCLESKESSTDIAVTPPQLPPDAPAKDTVKPGESKLEVPQEPSESVKSSTEIAATHPQSPLSTPAMDTVKPAEMSQTVVKSVEPLTGMAAAPPQSPTDAPAKDTVKPAESKLEVSPKPLESKESSTEIAATPPQLPASTPAMDTVKPAESKVEVSPKPLESKESSTEIAATPSQLPPDTPAMDTVKPAESKVEVSPKPLESKESSTEIAATPPQLPPDTPAASTAKPAESKLEVPQKPSESVESSTGAPGATSQSSLDTPTTNTAKSPEVTKKEDPQKFVETEGSSISTETSVGVPELLPGESTEHKVKPQEVTLKTEEGKGEVFQKPVAVTSETSSKSAEEEMRSVVETQVQSPKLVDKVETLGESSEIPAGIKPSEESVKNVQEVSSTISEIPSKPVEGIPKSESVESPKASEALEVFGKVFTSGPVVLKSEIPEEKPQESLKKEEKPCSPQSGDHPSTEPLEAFGKVFVSGPVTIKSEVEETDAVHHVFQAKQEEEPIYCNIEELEEIKVTSEEDRKKEKPQTSKLTEQILKAIPPHERKPFTEASSVSSEVSQFLASIEPQNVSILLDKPMTDEMVTAKGEDSSPVPPVPPRRNRSKGRDAPLPPPKKKGKNGKS